MQRRDNLAAARRWAKFPATVLIIVAVLWLLKNYFELDLDAVGQQTETGIGIFLALANLLLVPIGNVVIAICVLFVQRWSLWAAGVFLLYPLLSETAAKIYRIDDKLSTYRATGSSSEYGSAVMTIIAVLLVWALYGLVLFHLRKTLHWHAKARQWTKRAATVSNGTPAIDGSESATTDPADGDVCFLMPNTEDIE